MSAVWHFEFDGTPYSFDPDRDLTLRNLRSIKSWFGQMGTFSAFLDAFGAGDPDACACVVWMAKNHAGERNVLDPLRMADFSISGLLGTVDVQLDAENPTTGSESAPDDQIPDSAQTPTNSGAGTSAASPTSATSRRKPSAT